MPYIPSPTATLLSESTPRGNKPVDIGLILLLVGVVIIAFFGFTGWYMLAKYFRRQLGAAVEDVANNSLDVETPAPTEDSLVVDCIDEVADKVKEDIKVVESEVQFTSSLISAFKVAVYDSDSESYDDDDDEIEAVLNTPTIDSNVEPRMELSYVCAERSVNMCHVIESMESCHALVEEFPTPCEEPVLSDLLISAFKDAEYDACDDADSDEANDTDFSTDSQSLPDTPVLDIEQVSNLDIEKSIHELHVLESIQSCQAIVEEWIAPADLAQLALEESPVQPEAPLRATAESTIVDQVQTAPLALSSRPSRTANSGRPGTFKAPRATGTRSSYSERSRASGEVSTRTSLARTPARASSSSIGQGTSDLKRTPARKAPSTRPISSGTGTWASSSSQPAGPSRALHRGSVPITTGKISVSKRAPPAWRN